MANGIYAKWKQSLLTEADTNKSLNQTGTSGPFAALVDTGTYTVNISSDQYYSPTLTGIVGTDQEITSPTVANGTFDGADVTFTAVSGASVEAIVVYRKNTGANTTWRLVMYYDQSGGGLPVTPNGGNIVISWNASGIFTVSDKRAKENIKLVGDLFGKLPLYEYNYRGHPQRHRGVMAQDAERIAPASVIEFRARRGHQLKAVNHQHLIEQLAA